MLLSTAPTAPDAGAWVLGGLTAIGAAVLMAVKKKGEAVDKASILYLLAPVPLFALAAWLAHRWLGEGLEAWDFLALQIFGLLLGTVHVRLFFGSVAGWRALAWPVRQRAWSWKQFGFSLLLVCSGVAGLMLLGLLEPALRGVWPYWSALLTLLVPFLTVKAFDMYMGIPTAVYRPWYPLLDEIFTYETHEDFPKINVKVVIEGRSGGIENILFDPNKTLERLYRWVLHYHLGNEKELHYSLRDGVTNVWGWHFRRQRRGWFRWQRRLDPARTMRKCGLKDGDTLLAVRDSSLVPLDSVREEVIRRSGDGPKTS